MNILNKENLYIPKPAQYLDLTKAHQPEYIQKISPFILNNSNAAVGCNAMIFKNEITNSEQKMKRSRCLNQK
jgi:hypothetical protein